MSAPTGGGMIGADGRRRGGERRVADPLRRLTQLYAGVDAVLKGSLNERKDRQGRQRSLLLCRQRV